MKKDIYKIKGMGCQMCANKIQNKISKMEGVSKAQVFLDKHQLNVEYQEDVVSKDDFISAVDDLGYKLI